MDIFFRLRAFFSAIFRLILDDDTPFDLSFGGRRLVASSVISIYSEVVGNGLFALNLTVRVDGRNFIINSHKRVTDAADTAGEPPVSPVSIQ